MSLILWEQTVFDLARGIVGFGVNWLLQSTLLISTGLFFAYLLRRQGAAAQSAVYRTTLIAAVASPLLAWSLSLAGLSAWSLAVPDSRSPLVADRINDSLRIAPSPGPSSEGSDSASTDSKIEIATSSATSAVPPTIAEPKESSATPLPASSAPSPSTGHVISSVPAGPASIESGSRFSVRILGLLAVVLSCLWISIAAWLLATMAVAWWRLATIRRSAAQVDSATTEVCREIAAKLGVIPPTVLRTPFLPSPCLAGIWNPVVLLPEEKAPLPLDDVFIHELAHLLRKDCHWHLICNLAKAVFWFQPMLWRLSRRLKMAAEEVCDDFVVKVGGNRHEYAKRLVDFAEFSSAPTAMAGVAIVSLRSMLAHRVTRILDTSRHLSTHVSRSLLACTLAGGLVGTAIVGFVSAAPQNANTEWISGEVVVVETKDGSSVALEQAQSRASGEQSFVGGKVISTSGKPGAVNQSGSRTWIAVSQIARILEFDTKADFASAQAATAQVATAPQPAASPQPPAVTGTYTPRKAVTAEPENAADPDGTIAKIEALGGMVRRDASQPGNPVIWVNLSRSGVKDDDLQLVSHFLKLRELYLIGTSITDAGLKWLVDLQNLEELRVGNTPITDAGLKDLAKLKNLKMVGLLGTEVTAAGLKQFTEALPNVRHNLGADAGGGQDGGQHSDPAFDATVAQPAYTDTHPAVLFDAAHRNFHTASGRYKPFADLITNDGYRVAPGTMAFSPEQLSNYQILIISNAMANIPSNECDVVADWVKAGGSLLLITDFEPWGSPSSELGKRFGVDMSLRVTQDPANQTSNGLLFSREKSQIGDHPIMNGRNDSERVDRVLTWAGQSLKGPPESTPLLKFAATAREQTDSGGTISAAGRNQGLALEFGSGRVVVMGEAGELSAQMVGSSDHFGMSAPGCDNRKMALNIMHWLSNLKN